MQSCVHSFFFARPTDPPSREGGRWETKHFMEMALTNKESKVSFSVLQKEFSFKLDDCGVFVISQ